MKQWLISCYRWFSALLVDPLRLWAQYRALPVYVRNYFTYRRMNRGPQRFEVQQTCLMFQTADRFLPAGSIHHHYFHQDLWAARAIFVSQTEMHVDVGSRLDGFVAHVLPFCRVKYVDLRPLEANVQNLEFVQGSITQLPFANDSVPSLSCLHVIEHIGLGRYGDPVDPQGHQVAARELQRVLAPGGKLYFATPVGRQQLYFDAHRVFDPGTVLEMFHGLQLESFHLIDDRATGVREDIDFLLARQCTYGCGLFVFTK